MLLEILWSVLSLLVIPKILLILVTLVLILVPPEIGVISPAWIIGVGVWVVALSPLKLISNIADLLKRDLSIPNIVATSTFTC